MEARQTLKAIKSQHDSLVSRKRRSHENSSHTGARCLLRNGCQTMSHQEEIVSISLPCSTCH